MSHSPRHPRVRVAPALRPELIIATGAVLAVLGVGTARAAAPAGEIVVRLEFSAADVAIAEEDGFHRIALRGAMTPLVADPLAAGARSGSNRSNPLAAGAPALPARRVSVVLPPGMSLAAVEAVTSGAPIVFPGFHLPYPLGAPPGDDPASSSPEAGTPDPILYSATTPFPEVTVLAGETGAMRGIVMASALVFPVQYVAAAGELRLHREIEIRLAYAPAARPGETRERDPARSLDTARGEETEWLLRHVANPEDLPRFYGPRAAGKAGSDPPRPYAGFAPTEFPSVDGPPVEYVIVTDSVAVDGRPVGDLVQAFQRLADWKTQKGTPAAVRTVSWIRAHYPGHDDASRIRAFLIDAFQKWGTDYALLGGDLRIIPGRRFNGLALGAGHPPSDVYYGGLDSSWDLDRDGVYGEPFDDAEASDPYWDIWVGRAPVENREEADIFVERTLEYERAPGADLTGLDPGYYDRVLLMDGLANCPTWGLGCNGLYVGETIIRRILPPHMAFTRLYQRLLNPSPTCAYHQTYIETTDSLQTQWTTTAAFSALDAGVGFVQHFEHSNPYEEGGASSNFGCAATTGGALGREYIDLLGNGPNWSVVYSTGAGVNAFDYESVSEHWVLNPTGGAAAYIGKTRSGSISNTTGEVDTLTFQNIFLAEMTIGQAMGMATQSVSTAPASAVSSFGLLGDPELKPWTTAPRTMLLEVTPPVFTPGELAVAVTVRDLDTQGVIPGARVALLQADRAYAFATTDGDGIARFALVLPGPSAVLVTATAPTHAPATTTITPGLSATPHVVYQSHVAHDDSAGVANANGIADAGEVLKLAVTTVNSGTAPATGAAAELQVVGAVSLSAEVDGQCAPERLFAGAFDGHPPGGDGCTFRFPEDEFHGVSPNGRPQALITTNEAGGFIWRDGNRWHLIVRGPAAPAPPGMTIAGGCKIPGAFASATGGGLEPGDQWVTVGRDSVAFAFTAQVAGDVDSLEFTAAEGAWTLVPAATAALGNMAPGATAEARFVLGFTAEIPDRHEPRLEMQIRDGASAPIGRSSFSFPAAAPVLTYARQEAAIIAGAGSIGPVVRNTGSGVAGAAGARLRLVSGTGSVTDSVVTFGVLAGNSETGVPADSFAVVGTDTTTARFTVALTNQFPDGSVRTWEQSSLDLMRPCPPTGLEAEAVHGGSIRLSWTAPACAPDLAGYNIYRRLLAAPEFTLIAAAGRDSTRSFQDTGLAADTTWVFAVAARDSSGNESAWSGFTTTDTWIPELPGWPRALDAGTPSSPLVLDVDGDQRPEIFALGNALYGWHADGTPVIPGNPDGTIFRPRRTLDEMTQGATGAFFSSPAAADLDGDGRVEIAISAWDDSLWVVDALTGDLRFGRRCVPKYSSPAIGDLDGDGDYEIVVGSDMDTLYAWHHDGTAVNPAFPGGAFAALPNGSIINYATPGLADIDGNELTAEVIFPTFRGEVYAWSGDGTLLWTRDVGANRPLSNPAIGDVDQDGMLEVVVAQGNASTGPAANSIFIISATGSIERSWVGDLAIPGNLYSPGNYIHPPSLADLDGDGDLEILIGTSGITLPPPSTPVLGAATILVFQHDNASGYALDCRDTIPLPGLNMTNVSQQNVNAQPIIANLDGDPGLEIGAGSSTFGLFLFEADPLLGTCTEEPGWPLLFSGEVEATPVATDIDRDGRFDLVVRTNDGEVHVFAIGSAYSAAALAWTQFAHDPRHTSNYTTPVEVGLDDTPVPAAPALLLEQNSPNPFRPPTAIGYALPAAGRVRLAIYSADGRLVRTLIAGHEAAGRHRVAWDGRDGRGRDQAAGVYFYRLEAASGTATRKLILVR